MKNTYIGNTAELIGKPASISASAAMSGLVDLQDHHGVCVVTLISAGITDTDSGATPTATVKIQSSVDTTFGTAVDITGAAFTAISDSLASIQTMALDLQAVAGRYLRAYTTIGTETNATAVLGCTALMPDKGWV